MKSAMVKWIIGLVIVAGIALAVYLFVSFQYVYIDKSVIESPVISLSPVNPGMLEEVFVKAGDVVVANQPLARVGDEIIKAKVAGTIASINQNLGEIESPGQGIVATMVDPTQLRVVGHIDEDKGLTDIKVGEVAKFTVDAFGSKTYYGVVDQISQVSQSSTVNNIFNQRPVNTFDILVRFNPEKYPELKSGMSARLWVYKK